ncbi:hypothetical protein ACF3OE_04935 [Capnocytophaga canis]|uniref:hypothetical protein n=1 Tax=Capnocytophaga canis TaxID=1848903 RepID=UPI00370D5375
MIMHVVEPKTALAELIKELTTELKNYAETPNASQFVIKKREDVIQKLTDIELNLDYIEKYHYLMYFAKHIDLMRQKDSDMDGVIIKIDFEEKAHRHGTMIIKNYTKNK